jgi:hypothetical protein
MAWASSSSAAARGRQPPPRPSPAACLHETVSRVGLQQALVNQDGLAGLLLE